MDPDRIIAEVAKRQGVLLDPNDPILMVNTMLELHAADQREREDRLAQRDADLLAGLSQVLDQAKMHAGGQLARAAANELPRALDRLLLQRFRWWFAAAGAGLILTLAVGIGVGWWLHAPPTDLACADQPDGSRICWLYTRLPTQQAATRR